MQGQTDLVEIKALKMVHADRSVSLCQREGGCPKRDEPLAALGCVQGAVSPTRHVGSWGPRLSLLTWLLSVVCVIVYWETTVWLIN